jgi:hypothetical protein
MSLERDTSIEPDESFETATPVPVVRDVLVQIAPQPAGSPASSSSRPGISPETLCEAGVRTVIPSEAKELVGYGVDGLAIPYRTVSGAPVTVEGRPFYRIRLLNPKGKSKYLSREHSGCQVYFPPRLRALLRPDCVLGVVEGEFKSMALAEAGFPCVGIGGITSACPRNEAGAPVLLPALAALIAEVGPLRLAFIGDSDTALNADFAREAVKLATLCGVPVVLPRIPELPQCRRCDGKGYIVQYQHIEHGVCFKCWGSGIGFDMIIVPENTKPESRRLR